MSSLYPTTTPTPPINDYKPKQPWYNCLYKLALSRSTIALILCINVTLFFLQLTQFHPSKYTLTSTSTHLRTTPTPRSPPPLPSITITNTIEHGIYGGTNDKQHLGGFTDLDMHGLSPAVWKDMLHYFGVKSLLDVGCGKGISTAWFKLQGVDVLCVEGSHDAMQRSLLPPLLDTQNAIPLQLIEHDYSRGKWWPQETFDAVWGVEFLEHIGRNYIPNYIPTFQRAALLFVTHSNWGGWHHVEVHDDDWWINKLEMYGFVYSPSFTNRVRAIATNEWKNHVPFTGGEENYDAQHVRTRMLVFLNPKVASLDKHVHVLSEEGCFVGTGKPKVQCGMQKKPGIETPLAKEYWPLEYQEEKHLEWERIVRESLLVEHIKAIND